MQQLGYTRSARFPDHLLQTPDTFVRAPLPGMQGATAIVHAAPALGAQFTQYTAEFEAGGTLGAVELQRFLYVLEGGIQVGDSHLAAGGYAWLPPRCNVSLSAVTISRAAVIEKPYLPIEGIQTPEFVVGKETSVTSVALQGDPDLQVRSLLPSHPAFDMAVNTMVYNPGASLPMVEVHVMEHGLLMLEGGGIYRLGDRWYPTAAGDFIWMAPYLPQWFGALGKTPAKYLIYKDWNR